MCSRPASPNCPGSLFTSIRHFPPVIVANAHCTPLMIGEHTREKKPFYNSIFFHRRPYRLKLPLPRSDNSFALFCIVSPDRISTSCLQWSNQICSAPPFSPTFLTIIFPIAFHQDQDITVQVDKVYQMCVHVYDQFCKVLNRTELCKVAWKLPRTWLYCLTLTCALKMIYKQIVWSLWENEYLSCVTCFLT